MSSQTAKPAFFFRFGPLPIETSFSLPGLDRVVGPTPVDTLRITAGTGPTKVDSWYQHKVDPEGLTVLSLGSVEDKFLLRFGQSVDFIVSSGARTIECWAEPHVQHWKLGHLLTSQVLPLLLSKMGYLTFHAATVATKEGVIAFLGDSGMGKSTLAAAFAEQGLPVFSDDCLVLEEKENQLWAIPTASTVRLHSDSWSHFARKGRLAVDRTPRHRGEKYLVATRPREATAHREPARLLRAFLLDPIPPRQAALGTRISAIPGARAFPELMRCSFQMDILDRDELAVSLRRMALLEKLWKLRIPRVSRALPKAVATILDHLATHK